MEQTPTAKRRTYHCSSISSSDRRRGIEAVVISTFHGLGTVLLRHKLGRKGMRTELNPGDPQRHEKPPGSGGRGERAHVVRMN